MQLFPHASSKRRTCRALFEQCQVQSTCFWIILLYRVLPICETAHVHVYTYLDDSAKPGDARLICCIEDVLVFSKWLPLHAIEKRQPLATYKHMDAVQVFLSFVVRHGVFLGDLERMSFFLLSHQEKSLQGSIWQKSQFSGLRLDCCLTPRRRFTYHRDLTMKCSEDLHSSASLYASVCRRLTSFVMGPSSRA